MRLWHMGDPTCVLLVLTSIAPAEAQSQAGETAALTPKQILRAQRKAAHAKKKAEVSRLEKNGCEPNSDNTKYPQDLQDAQKKQPHRAPHRRNDPGSRARVTS